MNIGTPSTYQRSHAGRRQQHPSLAAARSRAVWAEQYLQCQPRRSANLVLNPIPLRRATRCHAGAANDPTGADTVRIDLARAGKFERIG